MNNRRLKNQTSLQIGLIVSIYVYIFVIIFVLNYLTDVRKKDKENYENELFDKAFEDMLVS